MPRGAGSGLRREHLAGRAISRVGSGPHSWGWENATVWPRGKGEGVKSVQVPPCAAASTVHGPGQSCGDSAGVKFWRFCVSLCFDPPRESSLAGHLWHSHLPQPTHPILGHHIRLPPAPGAPPWPKNLQKYPLCRPYPCFQVSRTQVAQRPPRLVVLVRPPARIGA